MTQKRRSSDTGLTKYLMWLPLGLAIVAGVIAWTTDHTTLAEQVRKASKQEQVVQSLRDKQIRIDENVKAVKENQERHEKKLDDMLRLLQEKR